MGIEWLRADGALPWIVAGALALVPLGLGLLSAARRVRAARVLAEPRHLHRLFPTLRTGARGEALVRWLGRRAKARAVLAAAATLLIAVAYLGPVRGYALVPVATRQIDVVIVLDTSRSMWVEDVAPNRLERAKTEIRALLDAMRGERAGLVAFAGLARSVAPLTRDVDTIRFFLERLDPEDNRKGGTDIGGALRLALDRFEGDAGSGSRAVVLVTDGEDLTGEGLEAARAAAEQGVRVHVLGMGTSTGGKIPDGLGRFVVDPDDGAEVISKLESSSLEAIASATGGIYLAAKGRVLPLEELYERAIAPMEGRNLIDGKERVPRDRYQWPLVVGVFLAVLAAALRDARSVGRAGRGARGSGLAGAGSAGAAALVALTLLFGATACSGASESEVEPWDGSLREGVAAMDTLSADGDYEGALRVAERMLEPDALARLRRRVDGWTRGASESVLQPLSLFLDAVGVAALIPAERGEVEFARGLVQSRAVEMRVEDAKARKRDAADAFGRAVGASGDVRGVALEALATLALLEAEELRLAIPAIAQRAGRPVPAAPPSAAKKGAPKVDPIEVARKAYLAARARFVECFAAGGHTEAATANSELCIRRLRELDALEEEQQQDQDSSDESQDGEDSKDDQEKDDSKKDDSEQKKGDESESDPSESDPSESDPSEDDERDPNEPPPDPTEPDADEPEEGEPEESEPEEDPSTPPEEQESEPTDANEKEAEAKPMEERRMTAEELERFLELNRQYQEKGEKVRAELRRHRKIPTQRDW